MPSEDTQFKPGESGNPAGRPKGSRNKLSEGFFKALADDFEAGGVAVIERLRSEDPSAYTRVIAGLMPRIQEHSGPDGGDIPIVSRIERVIRNADATD